MIGEERLRLRLRLSAVSVVCIEFEEIHGGSKRFSCFNCVYVLLYLLCMY